MRLLRSIVMVLAVCTAVTVTAWTLVSRFTMSTASSGPEPDPEFAEALAGVARTHLRPHSSTPSRPLPDPYARG